ncbi:hypothetical protein C8Q72DRAFT_554563 [Fomitopsis betulina]|nr:hypothetical protein C8Q72DRAFT_554563 [Fomitopsis betulina]
MSQANLEIVYYIWAPKSTAVDVSVKQTANFDAHVAWLKARAVEGTLKHGGAILTEDLKLPLTSAPEMAGLILLVKADDLAAARKFLDDEPYYKAGVWDNANIKVAPVLSSAKA